MLPAAFTFFEFDAGAFLSPLLLAVTFLLPATALLTVTFLLASTFLPVAMFLPPADDIPPFVWSTRSFRFLDGTESASLRQASSLAAPSQDLFDSNEVPFEARLSFLPETTTPFPLSSTIWHCGPGISPGLHLRFLFFLFFRLRHLNLSLPSFSCTGRVGQSDC